MNCFHGNGLGVHGVGAVGDGGLEGFMLNGIVGGLQYDLGKQFDGLRLELALEGEGEFSDLSLDLDGEFAAEGINKLVDLVLGVFFSAIEGSVGCEVGD